MSLRQNGWCQTWKNDILFFTFLLWQNMENTKMTMFDTSLTTLLKTKWFLFWNSPHYLCLASILRKGWICSKQFRISCGLRVLLTLIISHLSYDTNGTFLFIIWFIFEHFQVTREVMQNVCWHLATYNCNVCKVCALSSSFPLMTYQCTNIPIAWRLASCHSALYTGKGDHP